MFAHGWFENFQAANTVICFVYRGASIRFRTKDHCFGCKTTAKRDHYFIRFLVE